MNPQAAMSAADIAVRAVPLVAAAIVAEPVLLAVVVGVAATAAGVWLGAKLVQSVSRA